ncbi:hypothetical protein WICMUC_004930 [Wickerhamomyces mucosus]|uniref:t-SNARE coiled-coil homology domain-containing protein n=1 Tax=Wickerhamomyces mucosus TaxID=1378264 RepID=A0A9P8PE16_9ASCO|nr:hypothetical protein WICMUC_004930 [Wickerhamomyces mucosus]
MFRDRTNLFLSYRRTFPHHLNSTPRFNDYEEEEELIGDSIELRTLPPSFIDIGEEIDGILQQVIKLIEKLNQLYKKNLLPGFSDTSIDEEEIEKLNYEITSKFFQCNRLIKNFGVIRKRSDLKLDDIQMINNMEKNYALKIQQLSSNFRKIQNNYIKFLKKDEYSSNPINKSTIPLDELETESIENYSKEVIQESSTILHKPSNINNSLLRQREQEITKLAKGVLEVSSIFKEMQNLIIDQGTILDRIDYNLENVKVDLKQSTKELDKATVYQKRTQKCKVILLLSLVVFLLFMIVILKPHRSSSSTPPATPSTPTDGNPAPTSTDAPITEHSEMTSSLSSDEGNDFSIEISDPEIDLL